LYAEKLEDSEEEDPTEVGIGRKVDRATHRVINEMSKIYHKLDEKISR
jgi:hypothetical protein